MYLQWKSDKQNNEQFAMTEDNKLLSCILHNLRECLNSKKCCCFNEVYSLKKINAQNTKSYIFYVYYYKIRAINEAADSTWYIVFMQILVYPCNIEIFLWIINTKCHSSGS